MERRRREGGREGAGIERGRDGGKKGGRGWKGGI